MTLNPKPLITIAKANLIENCFQVNEVEHLTFVIVNF